MKAVWLLVFIALGAQALRVAENYGDIQEDTDSVVDPAIDALVSKYTTPRVYCTPSDDPVDVYLAIQYGHVVPARLVNREFFDDESFKNVLINYETYEEAPIHKAWTGQIRAPEGSQEKFMFFDSNSVPALQEFNLTAPSFVFEVRAESQNDWKFPDIKYYDLSDFDFGTRLLQDTINACAGVPAWVLIRYYHDSCTIKRTVGVQNPATHFLSCFRDVFDANQHPPRCEDSDEVIVQLKEANAMKNEYKKKVRNALKEIKKLVGDDEVFGQLDAARVEILQLPDNAWEDGKNPQQNIDALKITLTKLRKASAALKPDAPGTNVNEPEEKKQLREKIQAAIKLLNSKQIYPMAP